MRGSGCDYTVYCYNKKIMECHGISCTVIPIKVTEGHGRSWKVMRRNKVVENHGGAWRVMGPNKVVEGHGRAWKVVRPNKVVEGHGMLWKVI